MVDDNLPTLLPPNRSAVGLHIRSQFHVDFIPSGHSYRASTAVLLSLTGGAKRHFEVEPLCFLQMIDHL